MTIELIPLSQFITIEELMRYTNGKPVVVADAYVEQAEQWELKSWGWSTQNNGIKIDNVDHHAPAKCMQRLVSSGNLAIEFITARGPLMDGTVLINHCDCDSIVAAAVLSGRVKPTPEFGEAVLAADHTGIPNTIADALQSLESLRNLDLSLDVLSRLVDGRRLPMTAQKMFDERMAQRLFWQRQLEQSSSVIWLDKVALIVSNEMVPLEMVTSYLPDAKIIVSASPRDDGRWRVKARLGLAARDFTLNELELYSFDPAFGGRWNAGSNNRGGGTVLPPEVYASEVAQALRHIER